MFNFPTFIIDTHALQSLVSDITCNIVADIAITLPLGMYVMYCIVYVTMLVALLATHIKDQDCFLHDFVIVKRGTSIHLKPT